MRIVITDDKPLIRHGLKRLLDTQANFKVVGEASDDAEAVRLALELKPDILLLDSAMPRQSGLEALQQLRVVAPTVRVILLVATAESSQIVKAMRSGATQNEANKARVLNTFNDALTFSEFCG